MSALDGMLRELAPQVLGGLVRRYGQFDGDDRMAGNHRVEAVRAHLLERAGFRAEARAAFLAAAKLTASVPERRYLEAKAALTLPEH